MTKQFVYLTFIISLSSIYSLLSQVLHRFEQENGGQLLVATMCLLECSCHGLLETELLSILGDEDSLNPPDAEKDKESSEKGMISGAQHFSVGKNQNQLLDWSWIHTNNCKHFFNALSHVHFCF